MENNNMVDIPNYEGLYKFDLDLNQVYGIKRNRYLKNHINNNRYYRVTLCKNGKVKHFTIHRLVYMCNNPTEDISLFVIDHIDNNKLNNNIENLRKCCDSDNESNKKTMITNTTGYKNISKTKYGYKFQLYKKGKYHSKYFNNLQDAIEYRDIKVKEICGEFANLG